MAGIKSNFREVARAIETLSTPLHMKRRVGGGPPLGEVLIEVIALGILRRTLADQTDAKGKPYAALNEKYLRWKINQGFSQLKNVQTGKMISLDELKGQVTVQANLATMTYGRSEATRQLAEWATEGRKGGKGGRPPRPFYDLSKDDEKRIDAACERAIEATIRELGGS